MTQRQANAISNVVENGGNVSKAMVDAGYSPETAHTPQKLTESKAWKDLVEVHLSDERLLIAHGEALGAMKWNDFTGEREKDHVVRLKAVDLAYKVKGKLADATVNIDAKVLVIAGEALEKYEVASSTEPSSQGQEQIPSS